MSLPVVQFHRREGVIDLGWGHPAGSALPVDAWAEACVAALRGYGPAALTYGYPSGPGPLIEWLCDRLGRADGRPLRASEVFVTCGASQAIDLVATILTRPGDTVLVDSPTYHLALRVLADHGVDLVPAPVDATGIDPDATSQLIRRLRGDGRRVPLLYLVPTFNNPTGASLPADRRAALVEVARRTGVVLVEDDTYRELVYDAPAPRALFGIAEAGEVVRVGSFSKSVAPGIRLGWLCGTSALVATLADRGFVDSGGGVNHATAMTMAWFASSGGYDRHLAAVRSLYKGRRDGLVSAVRSHLPDVEFRVPTGGWFLWLRLPDSMDSATLLPRAEANGVSYVDGRRFHIDGTGGRHLRLAFSMLDAYLLDAGVRRLASTIDRASDLP